MTPRTVFGKNFAVVVGMLLAFVIFWFGYALGAPFFGNQWLAALIAVVAVVIATYLYYQLVLEVSLLIHMFKGGGQGISIDDDIDDDEL